MNMDYEMDNLLTAIRDPKVTRDDVAGLYADAIKHGYTFDSWRVVNTEIIERWSKSALEYIKREAWIIVKAK